VVSGRKAFATVATVARQSGALVGPGRTENRGARRSKVGQRATGKAITPYGGSAALSMVSFGLQCSRQKLKERGRAGKANEK
jgi:hypothetical protein